MQAPERTPSPEVLRTDFVGIFSAAFASVKILEEKFLAPYLNLTTIPSPSEYDLDVAAYCVLAHGVLEYLIEDVALAGIIAIESDWLTQGRASDSLAATLLYIGSSAEAVKRVDPADIRPGNDIRVALAAAKREISQRIYANNGISQTDVMQLVLHLGVSVRYRLPEVQASTTLTRFRGARAHGSPIYEPASPTDARTLVTLMLGLFRRITVRAAEKLNRPTVGMQLI